MSHRSRAGFSQTGFATVLSGLLLTAAFYGTAPFIPGISVFVRRYFCSHILEFISTGMFFTGMAILLRKLLSLPQERAALREAETNFNSGTMSIQPQERDDSIAAVQDWYQKQPQKHDRTGLHQRLKETLQYVRSTNGSAVEEHLKYLAEMAAERLHQSYAMLRTITWAIPILGFLGTVIGITLAIANVTPDQLDSSLGEVTGGLAVAFDTTALALGMSIVLVFASFAVERGEQNVLHDIEKFGVDHLIPWLEGKDQPAASPFEQSLQIYSDGWAEQLDEFHRQWNTALSQHVSEFRTQLDEDARNTLAIHQSDTSDARDQYVAALQASIDRLADRFEPLAAGFENRVDRWQTAMLTASTASAEQSEAIHQLGRTLTRMAEAEERLTQLQQQLNENLHSLEIAETLEQTVSSLTAAVHVLTARTSGRSAA